MKYPLICLSLLSTIANAQIIDESIVDYAHSEVFDLKSNAGVLTQIKGSNLFASRLPSNEQIGLLFSESIYSAHTDVVLNYSAVVDVTYNKQSELSLPENILLDLTDDLSLLSYGELHQITYQSTLFKHQ